MSDSKKSYRFHHAKLGDLEGRLTSVPTDYFTQEPTLQLPGVSASVDVVQFRSVPYAEIRKRFDPCSRLDYIPKGFDDRPPRDFTDYGFACPQTLHTSDQDAFFGGPLPGSEQINRFDEFQCLNLTISVPKAILQQSQPSCPVMVYIHGGGFLVGGGATFPLSDGNRLTALSYHDGSPVIVVTVNYRLGFFGYLSCSDLFLEQGQLSGKEKPVSVVGEDDQQQAFLWIQDQIAGFGGDPSNVTAFGESAGGGTIAYHCCSELPLFKRAIFQSSCGASKPPAELSWYDKQYFRLLDHLNITSQQESSFRNEDDIVSAHARLEALRKVPVDQLVQSVNRLNPWFFMPFRDHWHSDLDVNFETEAQHLHSNTWLEDLMMGDTLFEGTFTESAFENTTIQAVQQLYSRAFGPESSKKILDSYGIREDMDQESQSKAMMTLYGDFGISQTHHHVLEGLLKLQSASSNADRSNTSQTDGKASGSGDHKKKLYRYNSALKMPFSSFAMSNMPGPHASDVAFLFLNLLERFPEDQRDFYTQQTVEMARRWIAFANGKEPWPQYKAGPGERKIAILDDNGWTVRSREEDEKFSDCGDGADLWSGRRYKQWEIIEQVMDEMRGTSRDDSMISRRKKLLRGRQMVQDLTAYYMRPSKRSKL